MLLTCKYQCYIPRKYTFLLQPRVENVTESEEEQSANEDEVNHNQEETRASQQRKHNQRPQVKPLLVEIKPLDPKFVVRPRPISPPVEGLRLIDDSSHPLPRGIWLRIFSYMSQSELSLCMRVCRTWNLWGLSHEFWMELKISDRKVDSSVLEGIIRRQPIDLYLHHCNVKCDQMKWLLARLPCLKNLSLRGNSGATVSALLSGFCPNLESLDISWCEGVKDNLILDLLSPNQDTAKQNMSRFCNLKKFVISGCDVTDETMNYVARFLPSLECLDASYCTLITDSGVDNLTSESSICRDILKNIDFSGCSKLTTASSLLLKQCARKPKVAIEHCDKRIPFI